MPEKAEETAPSSDPGTNVKPANPAKKRKIKHFLLIGGVVVLVLAVIFFMRWWLHGRFIESTDDAYLKADTVVIAPKVSGYVSEVLVADNQPVKAGQPLVKLDGRQYQAAVEVARANIAGRKADIDRAHAQVAQQEAALLQAKAQLSAAQANQAHADAEVKRYAPLAASGADAPEHLALLKNQLAQANATLQQANAEVRSAQEQITATQAQIEQAQAQLESAHASETQSSIDAQDTTINSAIDGNVGDKSVRVGQFVQPGTRLMSIVPVQSIYLVANFKETQVGRMRAGQPATIHVDSLSGVDLHGTVQSFSPGTGAQFALLPPENATGNFTKIVQRVPVRIAVQAGERTRAVLLPGLSVTVDVDTHGGQDDIRQIKEENKHDDRISNRQQDHG